MIEFLAVLVLIVSALYLVMTFFSLGSLILNFAVMFVFYLLISRHLKDKDNHKYYLISLFLTALFFVLSSSEPISTLMDFLDFTIRLAPITIAIVLVYLFAYLAAFIIGYYRHYRKKLKR